MRNGRTERSPSVSSVSSCSKSSCHLPDSTAAALEGKRELNEEETTRLKQLWKKLVRMFHPDFHEHDPEKRKTYERLTQAINEARDRGDIELLEEIAEDRRAFTLKQGWASVSLNGDHGLKELRSLYEYLHYLDFSGFSRTFCSAITVKKR